MVALVPIIQLTDGDKLRFREEDTSPPLTTTSRPLRDVGQLDARFNY